MNSDTTRTRCRRARLRALEQGTSVNALLREYLEASPGVSRRGRVRLRRSSSYRGTPGVGEATAPGRATSSRSGRRFVDTNVLVYLFDADAPAKRERARELLATDGIEGCLVIRDREFLFQPRE